MGDETGMNIAKNGDANRSIYKCHKQPGAVYDCEDFSLLIFTFDQEKEENAQVFHEYSMGGSWK
jgi:hypothetical protein